MKYFTSQNARSLIDTYNFALFPVHGMEISAPNSTPIRISASNSALNEVIKCTCGNPDCTNPGKHPATTDGFKSASKDIEEVLKVWDSRKHLNVGIATGEKSGIFVIDIDSDEGLINFQNLLGVDKLPSTLTVKTAKGYHIYYKYPDEPVITKSRILDGVDVRGDGGYVIGPGSNHASGAVYEFINPLADIEVAPDAVLELVVKSRIQATNNMTDHVHTPSLTTSSTTSSRKQTGLLREGWTGEDCINHLSFIHPDCDYTTWINVGMALKSEGFGFGPWNDWSSHGDKYKGTQDCLNHWNSFKGNGITYGTVVKMAKDGGWKRRSEDRPSSIARLGRGVNHVANTGKMVSDPVVKDSLTTDSNVQKMHISPETGEIIEPRRIQLRYADDITPEIHTSDFVEELLCDNQFSVIYGESNCGKTFFMLDLAMHVALGKPWYEQDVIQGGVIYAALEGGHGTNNRIAAYKNHNNITQSIPLAVISSNLNFLDTEGDVTELIEAIEEAKERLGGVKLIIVDTLSRALAGGDENSSADMGKMIVNADAIRAITGAHIAFIHHSGKDAMRGARGHSSLRAAVDTEIEIKRVDEHSPSIIKVVKQREIEMLEDKAFRLERVILGVSDRNKEIASCVVVPCDVPEVTEANGKMNAHEQFVYDNILLAITDVGVERKPYKYGPQLKCIDYFQIAEYLKESGYKDMFQEDTEQTIKTINSSTLTARMGLRKKGYIGFTKNLIWTINKELENE